MRTDFAHRVRQALGQWSAGRETLILLTLLLPAPGRWIAAQERSITDAHKEPVAFVKFSPDGKTLASACGDKQFKLWDVATGNMQAILTASDDVSVLRFGPNGKTLLTGGRDVAQWDLVTGHKQIIYNCPG